MQVVLVGALPEEVTEWRRTDGLEVAGGFDRSPDAQAQAAELAVERRSGAWSEAATRSS